MTPEVGYERHHNMRLSSPVNQPVPTHISGRSSEGLSRPAIWNRSRMSGRRSVGHSNDDVLGAATQLHGRSRVKSLHVPVPMPDVGEADFIELFESEPEDPSCTAARKLDWAAFLTTVEDRAQAVLLCVAEGGSLRSVAIRWGVSDSTMQNYKSKLVAMRERQVGRAWQG